MEQPDSPPTPENDQSVPEGQSVRRSRARDRVERRKSREQRQTQTRPVPVRGGSRPVSRSAPRQLSPTARFKLSQIDFSRGRVIFVGIGAVVFSVGVVILLGVFANNPEETQPNAIWVGESWAYGSRSEEEIVFLADRLSDYGIGNVYALVSYLRADGTWAGDPARSNQYAEVEPSVTSFVQQIKRSYPGVRVLAWIVVPLADDQLENAGLRESVVRFSSRLIGESGFDGILLNVEPLQNNGQGFIALLRDLRSGLGSRHIAVTMSPDWTPDVPGLELPPIYAPGAFWEQDYKRQIALLADEIVITAYNTGFTSAGAYSAWVAYQVETFGTAVAGLDAAQLTIGVPAHDLLRDSGTNLLIHDPQIENISTALAGVRSGMIALGGDADVISGVALFSADTMDTGEWTLFNAEWSRGR